MAIPAQPCECVPYSNICCCTQNGITVVQPQCQNLPDGSVVNNPAFVLSLNRSFWTYKFLTDCTTTTRAISNFGIPICEEINAANITVEEKIDGCGQYVSVPFELIANDPNYGPAPDGFQFLKINTNSRFDKGLSVEYRISIEGNYPEEIEPIKVKTATVVYTFGCNGCFIVPGCNEAGELLVSKNCGYTITDNQAVLNYTVNVDNIGGSPLDLVQFQDVVSIPTNLTIGTVTVSPSTLAVDTTTPGQVKISGNLGTILPGGRVTVTYSIPIISVSGPERYTISNVASAAALGTTSFSSSQTTLDVVQLRASKCCSTDGSTATFNLTVSSVGASPDVTVDIFDFLQIPSGVIIRIHTLNGCEGYFAGTLNPIPLNTNLTGPLAFDILCRNTLIPSGGSYIKAFSYELVSSSAVGVSTVTNSITQVTPANLNNIIYLGTQNLPATASIEVALVQSCNTPC